MSPSSKESSTPVMVIVCATFQLADVNSTVAVDSEPSDWLLEATSIDTSAVGCELSTIWKVAVPPASVVVKPSTGTIVIPGASSSALVTDTSAAFKLSYLPSALLAGLVTTAKVILPSFTASSMPVTVTVCATFQLALLKVSVFLLIVPSVRSLLKRVIVTSAVG